MNKRILIPILLFTVLVVAGCDQNSASQVIIDNQLDNADAVKPTGEIKKFDMIASQWEFSPDTITVNLGDEVELNVESIDVTHGIYLPDFRVSEIIEKGEVVKVTFLADKRGTFSFSCSVPCGSGHGRMRGQLVVQ